MVQRDAVRDAESVKDTSEKVFDPKVNKIKIPTQNKELKIAVN